MAYLTPKENTFKGSVEDLFRAFPIKQYNDVNILIL